LRNRGNKIALLGKTYFTGYGLVSEPHYKQGMPNHDFDTLIKGEQYRQFLQQIPQPEMPVNIEFYKRNEISSDNVPE
jgi:hypothetical protein